MGKNIKILIVEDDERLAFLIQDYLVKNHYEVACHHRGDNAQMLIEAFEPDLLILDVKLPGKSGLDICRDIRSSFKQPILILTANDTDIDEILGLELGADDYLGKPVDPRLLLARIRALLRREQRLLVAPQVVSDNSPARLTFGPLRIDASCRLVRLHDQEVSMTTAEFDLLFLLACHAGKILSRDDILNTLRGIDFDGIDRSIDARISRLRRKLQEDPDHPAWIKTIRGKGYLFSHE